jgi:hypothetical protein
MIKAHKAHILSGALRQTNVAEAIAFSRGISKDFGSVLRDDVVPEGFPSMADFCMSELGFTRQSALKTIRVGRIARQFPEIFEALADGRLNRSAVSLLAPVLTRENETAVLAAAARRSNDEIRELVASYAPQLDTPLEVSARTPGSSIVSATPEEGGWCPLRHHPCRWFQNHQPRQTPSLPAAMRPASRWARKPAKR